MRFFWNKKQEEEFEERVEKEPLDYKKCKELFTEWALGKRLVRSLPNFALSTQREIVIQDAPEEAVQEFKKVCTQHNIDSVVKNLTITNRIYGIAGLLVVTNQENDDFSALSSKQIQECKLKFNILDPINQQVTFSQDQTSFYFQKPAFPYVNGIKVSGKRMHICTNGEPLFVEFEKSALNFAGRSVFKNMGSLIALWENLIVALDRLSTKASSILIKNQNAVKDSASVEVAKRSALVMKSLRQGGVASLFQGQDVEFFNLSGASELSMLIDKVKEMIAIALEDTPLPLLMDKSLSNGLSEGSEDMKAVVMAVENFRKEYLNPAYEFIDSYLFHKAWNDTFINEVIKPRYGKEYADLPCWQIRNYWIENFKYEWNTIYPETPDERTKKEDGKMDRLLKAKELGADTESLQANLNDSGLFPNTITLKEEESPLEPFENIQEEDEL